MKTLSNQIQAVLNQKPGLTDRELTDIIKGIGEPQQSVNATCRRLTEQGTLVRKYRPDNLIGNYLSGKAPKKQKSKAPSDATLPSIDPLAEDSIKRVLNNWLRSKGWQVDVAWGRQQGVEGEKTAQTLAYRSQRTGIEIGDEGELLSRCPRRNATTHG